MSSLEHPIVLESFAVIDAEVGHHEFNRQEYAIVRRAIHATADLGLVQDFRFRHGAIASGIKALQSGTPIVTDVTMVRQGIASMVNKTFQNPLISAIEFTEQAKPRLTRTETGILACWEQYPQAIYVIGNAPTALMALCKVARSLTPPLIVGVPVGFIKVVEAKQVLAQTSIPHICIEGRKGGSPVAAAIINALLVLAWEAQSSSS